jgi:O-antigen/teichoic acid export membrane protein
MAPFAKFLSRCRGVIRLLCDPQEDLDSPEARSRERRRRVILSALASALARALALATIFVSVPLTLNYLGTERYGMWMTISSLIAVLSFADLGMGNGLLNSVAYAHGKDDVVAIRRFVSSAVLVLSLVALCFFMAFALGYHWLSWPALFNVRSELARSEAGPTLAIFIALFALNIPLGIVGRVQTGLQQSFNVSLWQCVGSVMALLNILIVIHLKAGLPWLVVAVLGSPTVAAMCNTVHFFGRARPDLCPRRDAISREAIRHIMRTGFLFLILQIVAAVAYASDNLVIAQFLGASAVTEYAIPERLFSLIAMALAIMLAPLWPAYGEALSRGDVGWVRNAFGRSLARALGVAAVLSILLVVFAPRIIALWVGHAVNPPLLLLAGLGLWKVIEAGGNAMAMLLNGANVVRLQLVVAVLTGLSALTLKILLVGQIGVAGTVWASIIAFSLISVVPLSLWAIPRALNVGPLSNETQAHA